MLLWVSAEHGLAGTCVLLGDRRERRNKTKAGGCLSWECGDEIHLTQQQLSSSFCSNDGLGGRESGDGSFSPPSLVLPSEFQDLL